MQSEPGELQVVEVMHGVALVIGVLPGPQVGSLTVSALPIATQP
jgi:hypothetical protein